MSRALLSARQREIANLVASGKSNRAIAELLVLSERTVENHVATIFSKLDVNSRVELAAAVFRGEVDGAGASSSKGNLPPQLTSFVGREA
ncbi:MAG TPA: LuxR C-terminal-related transcriptional regulator, partial [Candidatus Baltobacteraceae bacterium]|nr:LuxR C-terminal-related transcriptional regulator [Candidatus Baltobacteraceae bacterium]